VPIAQVYQCDPKAAEVTLLAVSGIVDTADLLHGPKSILRPFHPKGSSWKVLDPIDRIGLGLVDIAQAIPRSGRSG
jgi:hypothetical protein